MATASPPRYPAPLQPTFSRTPSYSAEPGLYEQRLALNSRQLPRHTGNYIKKGNDAILRLTAQQDKIDLPVYGTGGVVEGIVEITKATHVSTVEVKVEGRLVLKEIAEGGQLTTSLCLDTVVLFIKDANNSPCPSSLPFALTLPTQFQYHGRSYPLPPSHSVKLKGLPGFHASIDYSVSAIINKPTSVPTIVPLVKSKKLGVNIGTTTVSTPFIYYPRTRPAVPVPSPLTPREGGFINSPDWKTYSYVLQAAKHKANAQDINVKLHLPASRIFCSAQSIPFHVTFEAGAYSLAAFLPYGPTTGAAGKLRATKIQLMRQSTVDVRGMTVHGTKTDIWRVDCIGEGVFKHAGDGATWMSFSGEIEIDPVKVMGFRIAGLSVQDCLLFTVTPPDVTKSPFVGIREMVPVRLTTDPYTEDGRGIAAARDSINVSVPPSPEDSALFEHAF
ncbi:hypothetical protein MIND_00757600 [Mycena indigotica]|uniref:Uncharacterized protein n=1 Tax=Mycena indigotica TaxID=2126181 RepID=A0A8H6SNJ9_9AGAR|nr:uncharacterized protein MIND_00757600 [Mycena indigotica]KAF7301916.1 hypothetical protein MIND_00757600 [Mycena indigotica]